MRGYLYCLIALLVQPLALTFADENLPAILAAIEANYSQFKSVEAKYIKTTLDARAYKDESKVSELEDRTVAIRQIPRIEEEISYCLSDEMIRVDSQSSEKSETYIYREGRWEQLVLGKQEGGRDYARLAFTEQMGGMLPLDIRHCLCDQLDQTLFGLIEGLKNTRVQHTARKGGSIVVLEGMDRLIKRVFDCDPRYGMLPVRMYTIYPDTTNIMQVVDVEYVDVLNGQAWWPKKVERRFFSKNDATTPNERDAFQQLIKFELVGEIEVNHGLPECSFTLEIPDGVEVADEIYGRKYTQRSKKESIWGWILGAVLAGGIGIWALKYKANRS